jgi:hypothetical protein
MRDEGPHSPREQRLEWRDLERETSFGASSERFDRMAYAMHLVRLLRPRELTVVFHESYREVRVERGRDYARGGAARWAMIGISQNASRKAIALAVAEAVGIERVPFIVDLLVSGAEGVRSEFAAGAREIS